MYDLQRASMWRRISAALCDFIAIAIVVTGMIGLLNRALGYEKQVDRFEEIRVQHLVEHVDGYDPANPISNEEYEKLTEAEKEQYKLASDAFSEDPEANRIFALLINNSFIMLTVGPLIAFVLLEFIVPLLFGNGQTLGKKIFGVAVIREDGVKISPMILFVRSILGKCTVETMLPLLIILMIYWQVMDFFGTLVLLGILILQLLVFATTKERKFVHDVLSHTVTVDYASQMIFDTPEALLAYKQRIHAEHVESENN